GSSHTTSGRPPNRRATWTMWLHDDRAAIPATSAAEPLRARRVRSCPQSSDYCKNTECHGGGRGCHPASPRLSWWRRSWWYCKNVPVVYDVFISYAREDSDFCEQLYATLSTAFGLEVFCDTKRAYAGSYATYIQEALTEDPLPALVVLASEHS